MKQLIAVLMAALVVSCAHVPETPNVNEPAEMWRQGHTALYRGDFPRAQSAFQQLATRYPNTGEGREALFYLGVIALDPRNPAWNPQPAAANLRAYLRSDSATSPEARYRPEARTLLALTDQLLLPADQRVPGLQPSPQGVPNTQTRVIVPAAQSRELAAEVARLRRAVADRDTTIQRQKDELERIRSTLAPRPR